MMNVNFSVLVCVSWFLVAGAQCQEIESSKASPSKSNSALVDHFNGYMIRSINRTDLGVRRLLSGHQIRFSVGQYWIDQYDSLINEIDRKVGIWGIDGPGTDSLTEFR